MSLNKTYKAKKRLEYKGPDFTATNIDLVFNLSDEYTQVKSTTRYQRLTQDRKAALRLDGQDLELVDVLLNGQACDSHVEGDTLVIENVPDDFELVVDTVISPASNTSLMGLYKTDGVFCTQCEPEGFRRITYFLDRPDVLAKYKVTIIAPEYGCGVLLSNGNLIESGTKNGRNFCTWEDPFPKPSYLFALVAGSFDIVRDSYKTKSGRNVALELYVDRGAYERGLWAMDCIKQSMKWDEDRFNLEYDLDNFKVVAVDFFNQGAMENKGLNIFNSIFVLVDPHTATDTNYFNVQSVIGHEYFHNWTGDRVTLRDWFQLSLKESLTVFRDQEFSSDVGSRALTRLKAIEVIRGAQFAEDASPMAHPVRPESVVEMNNFYTVTIYDKGAEVIRMIHTILGEELFQKGVAEYLSRYDGQAATIEDFIVSMEMASKIDLAQFRLWYTQAGTPDVRCKWSFDDESKEFNLTLMQNIEPTANQKTKMPMYMPVRTCFVNRDGSIVTPPELPENGILIFNEQEQNYKFTTLNADTLPVLFLDFSAPVKFSADYTDEDYKLMLSHVNDPFIKQDSATSLINNYIHAHIDKVASGGSLPEPEAIIDAFSFILTDSSVDPLLVCELIKIPSVNQLIETFKVVDLDSLIAIRDFIEGKVASSLFDKFKQIYDSNKVRGSYKYNIKDASKRALRNCALEMLARAYKESKNIDQANRLVFNHYSKANNFTDKLCAMKCATFLDLPCHSEILDSFEAKWQDDALVFDNYFRVQASAPSDETVYNVRKLMRHPRFDKTNPNRVRALIGTMALQNPKALHKIDGTGYLLLSDVIRELDPINQHVAAKLVTPLLSFRRFDQKRESMMREVLIKLKSIDNISTSLYEKINAALGA